MTKIIKSKVLVSVLLLALLCVCFCVSVSASETTPTASGSFGENVTWEFYEGKDLLRICGNGEMYSLEDISYIPWSHYYSDIKTLIIEEGVTNICARMFFCMSPMMTPCSLTRVEIPSTVTSIGESAFYNCVNLENIIFAQGSQLESIGAWAFSGCSGLSEITIPSKVTSIGDSAFYFCTGLTSVTFGDYTKISDFGETVFQYSEEGIERITLLSGAPINLESNTLHGLCLEPIKEIYVSAEFFEQYKSHEAWRDYRKKIFSLENTSGAPELTESGKCGENATYEFYESTGELKILGSGAVDDCDYSGLLGYRYRDMIKTVTVSDGITSLGDRAFYYCQSLTSVVFGENSQLTSIGEHSFAFCSSLTRIELPSSLTNIGVYTFERCFSLKSVTFGENSRLESIGNYAFSGCYSLASIEIPSNVTSIGIAAFMSCGKLIEVYNLSTLDISCGSYKNGYVGYYAKVIHHSKDEESIIEDIGDYQVAYFDYALYILDYVREETDLILPTSFNYKGDTFNKYNIYDGAFTGKSGIKNLQISESVGVIEAYAFQNCIGITELTIPSTVEYIAPSAFRGCSSLVSLNVEEGNDFYYSIDNCIVEASSRTLLVGCKTSVIPKDGSVIKIGDHAFDGCIGIETVIIPDSIKEIGEYAFFACSSSCHGTFYAEENFSVDTYAESDTQIGLKNVVFEGEPRIELIDNNAFAFSTKLTNIEIPASVIVMGSGVFYDCNNLLEYESGVSYVDNWVVGCDYDIDILSLREGTVGIADNAFSFISSLTSVELPSGITRIPFAAFSTCDLLASIEIPSSVTYIDTFAFQNCASLTSVTLMSNEPPTLDDTAFYISPLEAIYVPASALDAYKAHDDWAQYKDIIVPIGGTVTPEIMYGDVNGDGEIGASDVLMLRKYMANYNYTTETSTVEVEAGADVDGDGKIGASDVLMLRKYMANYNYETGSSPVVLGPKN